MKKLLNPRSSEFWLFACIIFGLISRIFYLLCYSNNSIFFLAPVGDGRVFLNLSRDLIYLQVFNPEFLFSSPIYTFFIEAFRFFAGTFKSVYIVQAILGILNIYLIFIVTKNLFNLKKGVVAAWIYALTPVFLFYESKISPLTLGITFILLIFLFIQKIHRKNDFFSYGFLGLFSGLLINTYSHTIFLILSGFLLFWIFAPRFAFKNRARVIFLILFFIISCLPVMIWFRMISGEHQFFPNRMGLQFYANNSLQEENETFARAISQMEPSALNKLLLTARAEKNRLLKHHEIDSHFALKRLKIIFDKPLPSFIIFKKNIKTLFSLKENTNTKSFFSESSRCAIFCILFIPSVLLLVLGLIGFMFSSVPKAFRFFLILYILTETFSFLLLDSSSELRCLLNIVMIPFAASIFLESIQLAGYSGHKKYLGLVTLIITAAFMLLFQKTKPYPYDKTQFYYNTARAYEYLDDLPSAVQWYQICNREDPGNIYIIKKASFAALKSLRYTDAELFINKGLKILPESLELHNLLGLVYMNTGRSDESEKEFQIVLNEKPLDNLALYNLALLYKNTKKIEDAIKYLKRIPKKSGVYYHGIQLLASIYQEKEDFKQAESYYKELKMHYPKNPFFQFKIDLVNELEKKSDIKN